MSQTLELNMEDEKKYSEKDRINIEKSILRKNIIKQRDRIYPADINDFSTTICKCICASTKFLRAKDILLYYSFGSEVRTDYIFEKAIEKGKHVYYPKVNGDIMDFYKVNSKKDFTEGFKGIMEPFTTDISYKGGEKENLIIVPGSVFGRDGYRIGYGRGYYDKFLSRYTNLYKIGVCYNIQMVDECPRDENDVCMDEIVTEKAIYNDGSDNEVRWI